MKKLILLVTASFSVITNANAADSAVTDQPWSIEISNQKSDRLETESQSISVVAHEDRQVTFGSFTCFLLAEDQLANVDSSVRPRTISCGEKRSALRISYEVDCKKSDNQTFKFADTNHEKSYQLKITCPQGTPPKSRLAKEN